MLEISHLTKTYGDKKAVDDLSLKIEPGEIYGFIGHNGAGKTTTLKSVVGILKFDGGEIKINATVLRMPPASRAETPPLTRPAPIKPPIKACDELDGKPHHHVKIFHAHAPISAPKTKV